jgi:acetyl-CoA carboxylase carboxyltransferase component
VTTQPTGPTGDGTYRIDCPLTGTVVSVPAAEGDEIRAGAVVAVVESMKMEHDVTAPQAGRITAIAVIAGQVVSTGDPVAVLVPVDVEAAAPQVFAGAETDAVRPDLAEVLDRQALVGDAARPDAVARRHALGRRTARENLDDLCDPGSFVEYGGLALAAQRDRRSLEELIASTPADGFIGGLATVNSGLFGQEESRCVVASYDYSVLAGTQGFYGHHKKDRLFELAARQGLPVVLFAEGGGGRPGDTSAPSVSGLEVMAFALFGRLSGLVPLVGVVSGRCFAGNAALLGCCDVIIATPDANIGMAGPAMIEGGGLGSYRPEDIGPLDVQVANGVVDVVAADEAGAVACAKRYLGFFQGNLAEWECPDQTLLRGAIPAERVRVYDIHKVVAGLADTGSVLELRSGWGPGMVTCLARIEGRPVGVIANNPAHLGGAIDSDGADKAARFMGLCDAFDIPLVFLCDTPGFMVGPEAEKTAQVRHFARMFVVGASIDVPFVTVILRKGYGLGAQAMAGGSFRAPAMTVAWPTGEIGGMGLEGAVRLGFRRELDAAPTPQARLDLEEHLIEAAYRNGKALNAATHFEIDDVIDPADTRERILAVLGEGRPRRSRRTKKRPCVDTW